MVRQNQIASDAFPFSFTSHHIFLDFLPQGALDEESIKKNLEQDIEKKEQNAKAARAVAQSNLQKEAARESLLVMANLSLFHE